MSTAKVESASSISTAASDVWNEGIDELYQDKLLGQCIIGGKEALSYATNIPMVGDVRKKHRRTSAFGTKYTVEKDFVSSIVDKNIAPGLGQVLANLFHHKIDAW